jgi:hypothetical protein
MAYVLCANLARAFTKVGRGVENCQFILQSEGKNLPL